MECWRLQSLGFSVRGWTFGVRSPAPCSSAPLHPHCQPTHRNREMVEYWNNGMIWHRSCLALPALGARYSAFEVAPQPPSSSAPLPRRLPCLP
jgi:hypothetical protein